MHSYPEARRLDDHYTALAEMAHRIMMRERTWEEIHPGPGDCEKCGNPVLECWCPPDY